MPLTSARLLGSPETQRLLRPRSLDTPKDPPQQNSLVRAKLRLSYQNCLLQKEKVHVILLEPITTGDRRSSASPTANEICGLRQNADFSPSGVQPARVDGLASSNRACQC